TSRPDEGSRHNERGHPGRPSPGRSRRSDRRRPGRPPGARDGPRAAPPRPPHGRARRSPGPPGSSRRSRDRSSGYAPAGSRCGAPAPAGRRPPERPPGRPPPATWRSRRSADRGRERPRPSPAGARSPPRPSPTGGGGKDPPATPRRTPAEPARTPPDRAVPSRPPARSVAQERDLSQHGRTFPLARGFPLSPWGEGRGEGHEINLTLLVLHADPLGRLLRVHLLQRVEGVLPDQRVALLAVGVVLQD